MLRHPTRVSDKGIHFAAEWEGFRSTPYDDGFGNLTIGYGHVIRPGEHLTHLTLEQGRALLTEDMHQVELAILEHVRPAFRMQQRFDATADACFNLGTGLLDKSHTFGALLNTRGRRRQAFDALLMYDHANGHVVPGLLRRRKAERRLALYGLYG